MLRAPLPGYFRVCCVVLCSEVMVLEVLRGPRVKDGARNKSRFCHPSTCNGLQENLSLNITFVGVFIVQPVPARGSGLIKVSLRIEILDFS